MACLENSRCPHLAPNTGDPNLGENATSPKVLGDCAQFLRISRILRVAPNSVRSNLARSPKKVEHPEQPVTDPTDFIVVTVIAICGWREFGGFRETRGGAGQSITDFTDFTDFAIFYQEGVARIW